MNDFGRMFRVSMLGESHGDCVGVLIDGCPSGISISPNMFKEDFNRRVPDIRGTSPRKEPDVPMIESGTFQGKTTGAPLLILIENKSVDSRTYEKLKSLPRPGHADFVAFKKFGGFNDYRGAGHFSGRLTAGVVAAGVIAKKLLHPIQVEATLLSVGGSKNIDKAVDHALKKKDSIGGLVECTVTRLPSGLGEPFFDSVESLLSHAAFSIPAIKGVEFGTGFDCDKMSGSEYNDEIINLEGKTRTNHAGGINGGITNGNDLVYRVVVRPTSSIPKPQTTVDLETGEPKEIIVTGRHDACIALRVPVVLEAMTAIVLADLMLLDQKVTRVIKQSEGLNNGP